MPGLPATRCRCLIALAIVLGATRVDAQNVSYVHALVIPPSSVGTCLPDPLPRRNPPSPLRGRALAIATRPPGGRRDITVFADSTGRIVTYSETADIFNGVSASTGEAVAAFLDRGGRWSGRIMHSDSRLVGTGLDSNGKLLRPLPIHSAVKGAPLTPADAQRVGAMVAWFRVRCP